MGQISTSSCEGHVFPQEWVKYAKMTPSSVLPAERAQPGTTGFAHAGPSHLSRSSIQIILNADRQSCYSKQAAALLSSGIRLTLRLEWTCLSACPQAPGNRADLQRTELSVPQIPSVPPMAGLPPDHVFKLRTALRAIASAGLSESNLLLETERRVDIVSQTIET